MADLTIKTDTEEQVTLSSLSKLVMPMLLSCQSGNPACVVRSTVESLHDLVLSKTELIKDIKSIPGIRSNEDYLPAVCYVAHGKKVAAYLLTLLDGTEGADYIYSCTTRTEALQYWQENPEKCVKDLEGDLSRLSEVEMRIAKLEIVREEYKATLLSS